MVAPATPALVSPKHLEYLNAVSGFTMEWIHRGYSGDPQHSVALRRRVAGSSAFEWWDGSAWQSSVQWVEQVASTYVFGAGLWPNGISYQWSVATRNAALEASNYSQERILVASTPPVVDVTAPTDPTESSRPNIEWDYSDAEGHPLQSYQIKLFSSGQYSAGNFDPDTSDPDWEVEKTGGSDVFSVQIGMDLVQGETYRAYVRVWQIGDQPSEWDFIQFGVTLTKPAAPDISVEAFEVDGKVVLQVLAIINLILETEGDFSAGLGAWHGEKNAFIEVSDDWSATGNNSLKITSRQSYDTLDAEYATYDDINADFATYDDVDTALYP